MIYHLTKTTAANTSKADALKTPLKVTAGFVYQFDLFIPDGADGLLHCQVFDGGYQVWPSSPGESFHFAGGNITFPDCYMKMQPPFEFTVVTWNNDETYDHKLQLKIGMVSQDIYIARFLPSYAYDQLGKVLAEQEEIKKQIQAEEAAQVLSHPITFNPRKR